ncbi:hypothetical protein NC652_030397 [Populus alba x Populus x berolinensis]|nr:hypothetical protein NC652_030397 [Populus alba x Populus x berolinensis]
MAKEPHHLHVVAPSYSLLRQALAFISSRPPQTTTRFSTEATRDVNDAGLPLDLCLLCSPWRTKIKEELTAESVSVKRCLRIESDGFEWALCNLCIAEISENWENAYKIMQRENIIFDVVREIRKSGWREQEERLFKEIYPKSASSGKKIDMRLPDLKIRVQGVMISLDE